MADSTRTARARVKECPECGGVLMGAGAMGQTRDFQCLKCGHETTLRHKKGTYIERDVPKAAPAVRAAAHEVPSGISFDEFMASYPNPKYQQ